MIKHKTMNNKVPVFVYGSLQSGLALNELLEHFDSEFYSHGKTKDKFIMLDLGAFPGIYQDDSGGNIIGEIYYVSPECLKQLDRVEGTPDFYRRKKYHILDDVNDEIVCYLYEWNRDIKKREITASYDWKEYLKEREELQKDYSIDDEYRPSDEDAFYDWFKPDNKS